MITGRNYPLKQKEVQGNKDNREMHLAALQLKVTENCEPVLSERNLFYLFDNESFSNAGDDLSVIELEFEES